MGVVFREMADEHPDADTGDVIFVLQEQEHSVFKRKGADLFLERSISLVEALCGFELEITHLDGRKLLVKTSPGEIVQPMMQGFDPFEDHDGKMEWEVFEDCDCPDIDNAAQADTSDVDTLKKACETQLKRKGIDVGVFVVSGADVEHHAVTDIDPVQSFNANKVNMQSGNEAYDEDDEGGGGGTGGGGGAQCKQM